MKLYAPRMFQLAKAVLGVGTLILGLVACQDTANRNRPTGPILVKIPVAEGSTYRMKTVELTTMKDIVYVKGEAAEFFFSPAVKNGKLVGYGPRIRTLLNRDGVYVGQDNLSVQILTIYANMEALMKFDTLLGVKDLNQWPRSVAVNARILDHNGNSSHNNARFSGQLNAFLFEPFLREDLPLTVNAGVMGHEHFHSLFYQKVLKNLTGTETTASLLEPHETGADTLLGIAAPEGENKKTFTKNQIYQLTLLRGINEGLADVWGWIFSGDTDFVARSLGPQRPDESRKLDESPAAMPDVDGLEIRTSQYVTPRESEYISYDIGSRLAKIIYRVARAQVERVQAKDSSASDHDVREQLARGILAALPKLTESVNKLKEDEKLAPSRIIEILSEEIPFLTAETCRILKEKVPTEEKPSVCKKFAPTPKKEPRT